MIPELLPPWIYDVNDFDTASFAAAGPVGFDPATGILAPAGAAYYDAHNDARYAPINNAHLTGVPTVPTAAVGTSTTQAANTLFVSVAIANLINSAPSALDTLGELATQMAADESGVASLVNTVAGKATRTLNLSDLSDFAAARNNLGLGSAATHAAGDFEPWLGNPGVNGRVLSSTTTGVRSWVDLPPPVAPGGANGAVQFNNAGVFDGFGSYDAATRTLSLAAATGALPTVGRVRMNLTDGNEVGIAIRGNSVLTSYGTAFAVYRHDNLNTAYIDVAGNSYFSTISVAGNLSLQPSYILDMGTRHTMMWGTGWGGTTAGIVFSQQVASIQADPMIAIESQKIGSRPLIIRGANGQTANLQEWWSYNGTTNTIVASVSPNGSITGKDFTSNGAVLSYGNVGEFYCNNSSGYQSYFASYAPGTGGTSFGVSNSGLLAIGTYPTANQPVAIGTTGAASVYLSTNATVRMTVSGTTGVVNFTQTPTVNGVAIGAAPGGSSGQLQYNNGGAFAAANVFSDGYNLYFALGQLLYWSDPNTSARWGITCSFAGSPYRGFMALGNWEQDGQDVTKFPLKLNALCVTIGQNPIPYSGDTRVLMVQPHSDSWTGVVVRGNSATQSGNLQEWQSWNGTTATVIAKVVADGTFYATIPGVGVRLVECGAVDSGGTGYRMLRVLN